MKASALKESLLKKSVAIGTWVFEFNTPGIARLLESTGIDFAVYDMEHSGFGIDSIRSLLAQTRPLNLAALVRPPAGEYHLIAPVLDAGADGVVVPNVETAEQARRIVDACRYAPQGRRGAAFSVAHDDFLSGNVAEKMKAANDAMICALLIESVRGLENLGEILSVPGVDMIWVGFLDLSISMGIPGQFDDSRFQDALTNVLKVCKNHGIPLGIMAQDAGQALRYVSLGFRCISYSGDIWLLQRALTQGVNEIRRGMAAGPGKPV